MKAGVFALAAAMAAGVSAAGHGARRHAHENFHQARALTGAVAEPTCGCTTYYTTITGAAILVPAPTPAVVPTPQVKTYDQPGTYTIPATTITLTSSTTVCAATSTPVAPGTHTYGGVTTIVKTSTTVVCPIATVTTSNGIVTSKIVTTTYVCPSAGTYTINPQTTSVSKSTILVYPTPATYAPGTYTADAVVTTITKTNYVVFCPLTSSQAPAPAPTAATVNVVPVAAPTTAAKQEAPKPEVKVAEAPKASATPVQSAPVGKLGTDGKTWAITYTPYDEAPAGLCKSGDQIKADIALIASKNFKAIRVYSTDCDALIHIPPAAKDSGIRLILGVFINGDGIGAAQEQVDDLNKWAGWSLVDLVVVGNEALFSTPPRASPGELAAFINSAKASFKASGYNGPVTTAEPLNIWQANAGALCDAVDIVGFNNHPFFNADVEASGAGDFARGQLEIASALCPGKEAYVLETGWPSAAYSCNGKACAGPAEQAAAIGSIVAAIGHKSVVFSFKDDQWKKPGPFGAEQHWGCQQLF